MPPGALDRASGTDQYLLTSYHANGGRLLLSRFRWAAAFAALTASLGPSVAVAKPIGAFSFVVSEPGDQRDPSIDGQYVVYSGPGPSGDLDTLIRDVALGRTLTLAAGPGDQDSPDVAFTLGVYRGPAGIAVVDWYRGLLLRAPAGDGVVSAPVIGSGAAAWEVGNAGNRDVAVYRMADGAEWLLAKVGDQHSPSVEGSLVAWVDDSDGGSIWVHDADTVTTTRFKDGRAASVAVAAGPAGPSLVVAQRFVAAGDDDIEVYDGAGGLVTALRVAGVQRRPHVSSDWIAFEDVSTAFSQVVIWNWRTGLIFVPRPSETDQTLNDVSMGDAELRVVFEDSESPATGRDIALYRLQTDPLLQDDTPTGWPITPPPPPPPQRPARCDEPDTVVLATLDLGRDPGKPLASEVTFEVAGTASSVLPVLVCIDAERVSAGWITVEDEAVATPSDFNAEVVHLEAPAEVRGTKGSLAGIIAGKPGSSLTARVLGAPAAAARPATAAPVPADPATDPAGAGSGPGGCGTPGGFASLLPLLLLLARRRVP